MGEMQTVGSVGQAFAARLRAMVEATGQAWPEASATTSTPGSVVHQCEWCLDLGYVRLDVAVDDPQFGKMLPCPYCQKGRELRAAAAITRTSQYCVQLPDKRFADFQKRGGAVDKALLAAQRFAENPQRCLVLWGDKKGTGKTHLCAAAVNRLRERGVPVGFFTAPDLLDLLRGGYARGDYDTLLNGLRNLDVLALDDMGVEKETDWATEKLFQIINHRYINKLPTVITSNQSLTDFEPRIRSRLQDPDLVTHVEILAPDFRNPTDDIGHPELSSLNHHSKQTFGSFSFRKNERLEPDDAQSLLEAFEIAKKFAESPQGWLVFYGPYGCGKTHLAAAIGNYQAGLGYPPLFVGVPDLLDYLRAAFSPNSSTTLDRRFYEIRSTRLLILDDIGTESATPWAREKLYQLINHRYNAELPTVMTTASEPSRLDQRIFSRMSDKRLCKLVLMSAPTFTGEG